MKKTLSVLLALCLTITLCAPFADAASGNLASAQQTVTALGIMVGDENGNMNLSAGVTRAQLAKMMIAASTYKDTVSGTSATSPFIDVNYKYWAASYIQTAVNAGWLTGYLDSTYRPNNGVTVEEGATAILKMLGYKTTDFSGAFPDAQLVKYTALGLNAGITKTKGQYLTRQDAMYLFYNLMSTKTTDDKYYAATLGYTVNSSGEIDYNSLVSTNMKGPFIVTDSTWASSLPFSTGNVTVYKNGSLSSLSAVSTYDVYYYNKSMRTVWVYRNQVTGVYTAASPSKAAPTTVTVAGNSYSVTTSAASYALSTNGSYKIGDTVTLLLGMNGDVVGVESGTSVGSVKYGIITATGTKEYTDSSGNQQKSPYITLAATDGGSYDYYVAGSYYSKGEIARISYENGALSVTTAGDQYSLSGTVNTAGTAIGSTTLAGDIEIMDSTDNGSACVVYPSRLAGMHLSAENIRYYTLNTSGQIDRLILRNVTGDMYQYGVLTSVNEAAGSSNNYSYIIDGTAGSCSSTTAFGAGWGPAQFELSGTTALSLKSLKALNISALTAQYGISGGTEYPLADKTAVYVYKNSTFTLSSISTVSDGSYSLTAYYDKDFSSGGRIRVIVAS